MIVHIDTRLWTLVVPFLLTITSQPAAAIVNNKIDRIIDLSSQVVKITERILIEDTPERYIVKLDPTHRDQLAYVDATLNGNPVALVEQPDGSYEANLAGQSLKQPLVITSVFTRALEPYPAEIRQNERQFIRYHGIQTTLSPYLTRTSTTKIKLPQSSRLESFTKASKMNTGSNKLTYGPFKDVQPDQADLLTIHFENNSPFVAVTHLDRVVELSPWAGSISVANEVKVSHIGAKLKGPFSRIDYQREYNNGMSSVRSFAYEMPKTASGIYFRDAIGNISTSSIKPSSTKTTVHIKPRFPLFGGWVTDFMIGYYVPMRENIKELTASGRFQLSIPLTDIMFENMFIDEANVKIILPAGASNVRVHAPINLQRYTDEMNYSYLDVIGRPVVSFKKANIVSQHVDGKPILIHYNYSKIYLLQEPILLVAAAIGAFILAAIYSRLYSSRSATSGSAPLTKPKSE